MASALMMWCGRKTDENDKPQNHNMGGWVAELRCQEIFTNPDVFTKNLIRGKECVKYKNISPYGSGKTKRIKKDKPSVLLCNQRSWFSYHIGGVGVEEKHQRSSFKMCFVLENQNTVEYLDGWWGWKRTNSWKKFRSATQQSPDVATYHSF